MDIKGKRILITGGGGALGSYLIERCVQAGSAVTTLDLPRNKDRKNSYLSTVRDQIETIWGDMTDKRDCFRAVQDQDIIIHAAATGPVPYSIDHPVEVWENNVKSTLNLFEAARTIRLERIVNINSSESYGTALSIPITESHPFLPRSPYGASKAAAEMIAHSYHITYGLPVVLPRLFNTFGPRGVPYNVIHRFIALALDNQPLPVAGDGQQQRDYIFMEDAADAIIALMTTDAAIGQPVNIAGGETRSIIDIAQMVVSLLQSTSPIEHRQARPGEVRVLYAGIDTLRSLTGWQPAHSFEAGLQKSIDYIKNHRQEYQPTFSSKSL